MADYLHLPDEECNRVTPLACMHGVVASLALAAAAHGRQHPLTRAEQRQQQALRVLAESLALVFTFRDDEKMIAEAAPLLLILMRDADRCERRGRAHITLLPLPETYPLQRLRIDPPHLCLAAVMRLRADLEKIVAQAAHPRRVEQLKLVLELEAGLRDMARERVRRKREPSAIVAHVDALFGAVEEAIGFDAPEIFHQAEDMPEEPRVLQ